MDGSLGDRRRMVDRVRGVIRRSHRALAAGGLARTVGRSVLK